MVDKFLQSNLNTSRLAQDNFLKRFCDWNINIAILSEPNYVSKNWIVGTSFSVAIVSNVNNDKSCVKLTAGDGYVAALYGSIIIIACYFRPNVALRLFKKQLEELAVIFRSYGNRQFILAGDFNANLIIWGSNRNTIRRKYLYKMAASLDLRLINDKITLTCIRAQGTSVFDLTWSSPGLTRRIQSWKVLNDPEHESFSDHLFIRFDLILQRHESLKYRCIPRRWSMKNFDAELFAEIILPKQWNVNDVANSSINHFANLLIKSVTQACDAAACRVKKNNNRQVHWWNYQIAEKR